MISSLSKFPLRQHFLEFRRHAKHHTTSHLQIIYCKSNKTRLGVIIPKKVHKLATSRNYFKRLTYDYLFQMLAHHSVDCVVLYKPLPLSKSKPNQEIIQNELSQILDLL